ncbi:hypothetical protein LCGC14_2752500, partial [marine sediment metagenome]
MRKMNGSLKVILIIIALVTLGAGIIASYAVLADDVDEMKPKV